MDQTSENINDFECLLKNRSSKKPLALYASSESKNLAQNSSKTGKIGAEELLASVSRQVKAMQNADVVGCKRNRESLDQYKNKEILPINRIPIYKEVLQKISTKFETQCISDTQLINMIENAEIVDKHRGITQEFDETFCQNSKNDSDDELNDNSSKLNVETDIGGNRTQEMINIDRNEESNEKDNLNDHQSKIFENSDIVTCEMDTITCYQSNMSDLNTNVTVNTIQEILEINKCIEIPGVSQVESDRKGRCEMDNVTCYQSNMSDLNTNVTVNTSQEILDINKCIEIPGVFQVDTDRALSPVLNNDRKSTFSPIVVDLYTFEKFENLANPIIEENEDLVKAKNMINSQILGREILLPAHNYEDIGRNSPIISKIECITTNINEDDAENICKCIDKSNDCIDRSVKCTNELLTEDIILGNGNKKPESKIIKTEIPDEILFSSDEELEYLHKDIQELPLTCALETSFYDKSDVLDKTMYVGFQTASNKSIQINTDSYTKAKSMLSDIDNVRTEATLSDLVEIFDSGKAKRNNTQNIKLTSNVLDNIPNESLGASKNLTQRSDDEFEEKRDDTLADINLTVLEHDKDNYDNIVKSQVLNFKGTSISAKINTSITSDEKINKSLIEQLNKDMDDDLIMSQVISFKSISRTPKNIENIRTASVDDETSQSSNVIAKRKLVGFKTASNKKIKLSDKALARCKKVFQDIDLDNSEYVTSKSNTAEIEKSFLIKVNCLDFDRSGADYQASSTDHNKEEKENENQENLFDGDMTQTVTKVNYHEEGICWIEDQPKIEDIDLQINDQHILQEFEDNDMPFEETNNNAYVHFKTASNKNITISDVALAATKHVFQDIITISTAKDSETQNNAQKCFDDSGTHENVFEKPESYFQKVPTRDIKLSLDTSVNIQSDILLQRKQGADQDSQDNHMLLARQTAPRKKKLISEKARENSKDSDEEDFKNRKRDINTEIAIADEFNCGIDTQNFLAEELLHIEDLFTNKIAENEKPATPLFQGFQTASKKTIVVSEKALEKSKKMFEDITDNECEFKCHLSNVRHDNMNEIETAKSKDTFINEQNVFSESQIKVTKAKSKKLIEKKNKVTIFTGIHTASNSGSKKEMDASIENQNSVQEGIFSKKPLYQNNKTLVDNVELKININTNDDHEKEVSNNLSSHSEVKNIGFKESDRNDKIDEICKLSSHHFIGFQTASNKKIEISTEALAKSKQLFKDVDIFDEGSDITNKEDNIKVVEKQSGQVFKGFQTISNKKLCVSETALKKYKSVCRDIVHCDLSQKDIRENVPMFRGFQTASNKRVEISEKALANSKKLFEDLNLSQMDENPKMTVDSNFSYDQSGQMVTKPNDILKDVQNNIYAGFKGFQTASNKQVEISEKALASSKKLFKDLNLNQPDKIPLIYKNQQTCFQTASNCSKSDITKTVLAKTKDINIENMSTTEMNSKILFKGFQTASRKKVEISEEALAKCKKLFEDINFSQLDKDPPIFENKQKSIQTANNKRVEESEKAVAETKDTFIKINVKDHNYTEINDKALFKGFQTASNKKVEISEKALTKSKKLFDDIKFSQIENEAATKSNISDFNIDEIDLVTNNKLEPVNIHYHDLGGFPTASNNKVNISKQALAKCRGILIDHNILPYDEMKTQYVKANLGSDISNHYSPATSKIDDVGVLNKVVIDTQVLNDFQTTLNTEDFCKSTPVSKRSGSPILSCPRAKKRKFETPYRTKKKIEPRNPFIPPKLVKTYMFNDDYKKHKKYTLEDIEKLEKEYTKADTDPYILEFTFDTMLNFVFTDERNDYTVEKLNIGNVKNIFLDSVNKKIVPDGWLDSHIKLIIWKLLSYEVKFPNVMKNICTVKNVLEQLKYRYDRELYHVQRPILRKIMEKDEVPSKTMVLCVAAIYVDNISVTSVPSSSQNVELLLTDGWYCVKSCLDRMLVRLVATGAIVVGTKLAVCGAELINCEQGVAPWEDTSSVRLKLHGNSTRRARCLARLGARAGAVACGMRAARADGGKMAATRVAVARVYPPLFLEKMDDGSTVTLSERLENIRQMKYESERRVLMEKLYEEIEKEMSDLESQDSEGCSNEKSGMETGSQISKSMKKCKDPDEYRSHLTKSQSRMLEDHNARQREKLIERVRERFQQKLEKNGLKSDRNVVPLLKVRVAGVAETPGGVEITKGYLSIWKPSAAVLELVTEGAWVEILNVIPTGVRNAEIQLSAGRQTVFNPYKQTNEKFKLYAGTLQRKCYEIREITQNPSMTTDYNEVDTVGMIFCIEPSTKEFQEQSFQNVYLADADKNIICVNFWGGLKKFGFENVLDTGQIITCVNLQKRAGNSKKSIPQYRVTEFTYFTKTPKSKKALEITEQLTSKLSKINDKFCEDCILLKNNYSLFKMRNNENISPYRFDYNIPKNVTPLRNCDANFNLTGLDFESSFNSQDISPQALLRKKKVNEKIEKIRIFYGEPPPLSSMHIINKSKNASSTYKSPLISNFARSKLEPQPDASPVSMNRTYVKNVNPVKLNFSNDLNESVDHFAEDFDASPPLSLDSDVVN